MTILVFSRCLSNVYVVFRERERCALSTVKLDPDLDPVDWHGHGGRRWVLVGTCSFVDYSGNYVYR